MARGLCRSCYKKQYRQKNAEHMRELDRRLRQVNLIRCRANMRKYKYSNKGRYKYMQLDAKRRGLECTLTFDEYSRLLSMPCYYCEMPLPPSCCTGLDRQHNDRGYVPDNVVPCCGPCNVIRGDRFTSYEMKLAISAISAYRQGNKHAA